MTAKSFCYACAGVLMLAIACHFTVLRADATYVNAAAGHVRAWDGFNFALRSDGTTWRWNVDVGWTRHTMRALDPPVPVQDIAFWDTPEQFITIRGEMYMYCASSCNFLGVPVGVGWHVVGTMPSPTVQVDPSTMGKVKEKYRDE